MTDRSIPHLRDIFGFHNNWSNNNASRNHGDDAADQMKAMRLDKDSKKEKKDHGTSGGNDSAISSIGSASEEDIPKTTTKKKKQRSRRENSKTLTEKDVKHLERHLSMKKTIRKKIMRDLQQAFVEDPNEFRVEDREQLKAEINIQSLSFGNGNLKTGKKTAPDPSFLDMLRGGSTNAASSAPGGRNANDDGDSGRGSPTRELSSGPLTDDEDEEHTQDIRKSSFWSRFTIKGRNKR